MEEDQSMEIEALEAIYGEDFKIIESEAFKEFEIVLVPLPTEPDKNFVGLTLEVKFPSGYPNEVPSLIIKDTFGIDDDQVDALLEKIKEQAAEEIGTPMIFNLATTLKEWLDDNNFDKKELERQKQLKEEEEREARRKLGTPVTEETFNQWADKFYAELDAAHRKSEKGGKLTGRKLFETKPEMLYSDASFGDEGEGVEVDWSVFNVSADELPEDEE